MTIEVNGTTTIDDSLNEVKAVIPSEDSTIWEAIGEIRQELETMKRVNGDVWGEDCGCCNGCTCTEFGPCENCRCGE